MQKQDILRIVMERGKTDPWCQACRQDLDRREEGFLALRQQLTNKQQEQLDLYIAACEAYCDAHIFVAWELGREFGRGGS